MFLKRHILSIAAFVTSLLVLASVFLVFVPNTEVPAYGAVNFADDTRIIVEVADTPAKRQQGLGQREALAESEGMLFLFEAQDVYVFWMKDMAFPIDIIWLRGNTVIDVDEQVQVEEDLPLTRYVPDEPVDAVLEVRAGFVQRHRIDIGENIEIWLD